MEQPPYATGPYGAPTTGSGTSPAPRRRSTATYIAWGCVAAVAVICLAGAALGIWLALTILPDPKGLAVDHTLPFTVTEGQEFEFVLQLRNTGTDSFTVGDIDLDQALGGSILDGAVVVATEPPMERDYSITGIKTFKYNRPLAPGETGTVTFTLKAGAPGEYSGSIGVYVGSKSVMFDEALTVLGREGE